MIWIKYFKLIKNFIKLNFEKKYKSYFYSITNTRQQKMSTTLTNLNKYLKSFLLDNYDEEAVNDLMKEWNIKKHQEAVQNIIDKNLSNSSNTTKKIKDPNAPKRAQSAYLFFCKEMRPKIKEEHPDMDSKEILKQLGVEWKKACSSDDKNIKSLVEKCNKAAEEDKVRYKNESESYVKPSETEIENNKGKKSASKKKEKLPGQPSSPTTAYMFFMKENKEDIKNESGFTGRELISEIAKRWKNLDENEKEPYVALNLKSKKEYKIKMEEFLKNTKKDDENVEVEVSDVESEN